MKSIITLLTITSLLITIIYSKDCECTHCNFSKSDNFTSCPKTIKQKLKIECSSNCDCKCSNSKKNFRCDSQNSENNCKNKCGCDELCNTLIEKNITNTNNYKVFIELLKIPNLQSIYSVNKLKIHDNSDFFCITHVNNSNIFATTYMQPLLI